MLKKFFKQLGEINSFSLCILKRFVSLPTILLIYAAALFVAHDYYKRFDLLILSRSVLQTALSVLSIIIVSAFAADIVIQKKGIGKK